MLIDLEFWQSKQTCLLLNPQLSPEQRAVIAKALQWQSSTALSDPHWSGPESLPSHLASSGCIWLKSSGTESFSRGHKLVCLTKQAVLSAARCVVDFLELNSTDRWLCPLPSFHIGGVAVSARCFVAGAGVEVLAQWSPSAFVERIVSSQITLVSLVPTQVYDLIDQGLSAPASLRVALVGGGALKPVLYKRARALGWPLLPSYGMTETSALMACAELKSLKSQDFPRLRILPHLQWKPFKNKFCLHGPCLYSGFLWVGANGEVEWQQRPRSFLLDDRLEMVDGFVRVLGRESELIKILGESVNLLDLESRLASYFADEVFLVPVPDQRRGFTLHLAGRLQVSRAELVNLNKTLIPFERVESYTQVESFPKNDLGKIQRQRLRSMLVY